MREDIVSLRCTLLFLHHSSHSLLLQTAVSIRPRAGIREVRGSQLIHELGAKFVDLFASLFDQGLWAREGPHLLVAEVRR